MMTDKLVFLDGVIFSSPDLRPVVRINTPRSVDSAELSTAVAMRVRLLENMNALSRDREFAEPAYLTGSPLRTAPNPAQTPQEAAGFAEEENGENTAATLAATVIPPEMPEVFPSLASDAVRVLPAASIEYKIIEPPRSDIFFMPERNALDLRA